MSEYDLSRNIQVAASQAGCRLWRNNVAEAWVGIYVRRLPDGTVTLKNSRPLHAGLVKGSSDLIGLTGAGVFLAIEVKTPTGRVRPEQRKFIETIRQLGGRAGIARSVQDAINIINGEIRD